jgi:protein-tyrosine-phosphatase
MAPADEASRIRLFGEVTGLDGEDVPDPYYGTDADFARVLAMLETGMARLAAQLQEVTEVPAS